MMKRIVLAVFIICSVCFYVNGLEAGNYSQKSFSIQNDRGFDEEKVNRYLEDDSYEYYEEPEDIVHRRSRFGYWLSRVLARVFNTTEGMTTVWIILGIIALYFILKYVKIDPSGLFSKQKQPDESVKYKELEENIHEIDFDKELKKAIENKNLRLAVRILYLKSLKVLTDKEIINWRIDKTNYEYFYEIKSEGLRKSFIDLSLIFDHVWYGEFDLSGNQFNEVNNQFEMFTKSIGKSK